MTRGDAPAASSPEPTAGRPANRHETWLGLETLRIISRFLRRARKIPFSAPSTISGDTLVFVAEYQNVTLSVPRDLLKRVKRLAADRDTSVSALMTEALSRLADEDRRYSAARKRTLAAMKSARSLGTRGRRTWTRDELHER